MNINKLMIVWVMEIFFFASCVKGSSGNEEFINRKDPVTGSRIAWDYSSLQRLVPLQGNSVSYSSYPRMIELDNGDYMCVYEADGNIDLIRSCDKGATWSQPQRIASRKNNIIMAVPEIIQISNKDIIVSYNPRPLEPYTQDRHFAIRIKKSKDNGNTWSVEKNIYTAGISPTEGCWEPYILELPDGELQLYFANEADYPSSDEQNISMLRSFDKGETWGEKEIISFSPTSRDGMPVSLYLNDFNEIIVAIEDNYLYNFKPAIIRTSDDWANAPVGRDTPDRVYALSHDQRTPAYQGAPYIRKLPSGNIVLSYQGTDGETNHDISNARMHVEIGDKEGKNFKNNTTPFDVPTGKSGLWNSLAIMDGKVWALTSTNAFSNISEVWVISGYEIIDNYKVPENNIPPVSGLWPFFVGHKGKTNAGVRLSYSNAGLHLKVDVFDNYVTDGDGIVLYIDPANVSSDAPVTGVYSFTINTDGNVVAKKGFNGNWTDLDFTTEDAEVTKTNTGYEVVFSIPWEKVGGMPQKNVRIGFSVTLNEHTSSGSYEEELIGCDSNKPYTWTSIIL